MSLLTITDVDAVRAEGALKPPEAAAGAATDRQIQAAIRSARRRMIEKVTEATYETVQEWTDSDLESDESKDEQYDAFLHAESCFTIGALARRLSGQQLSATGLIGSIEIGKAKENFAQTDEIAKLSATWMHEGNRWLSAYLTVPIDTITQLPTSFASRKGTFYVGVLDQRDATPPAPEL